MLADANRRRKQVKIWCQSDFHYVDRRTPTPADAIAADTFAALQLRPPVLSGLAGCRPLAWLLATHEVGLALAGKRGTTFYAVLTVAHGLDLGTGDGGTLARALGHSLSNKALEHARW
jgi:hypothetical protein